MLGYAKMMRWIVLVCMWVSGCLMSRFERLPPPSSRGCLAEEGVRIPAIGRFYGLRLRGGGRRFRRGQGMARAFGDQETEKKSGETIENVLVQRQMLAMSRQESEQGLRLRKRREEWERKVNQRPKDDSDDFGNEDELSSEGEIDADRPDTYVKPEQPVETDFKETGLPDWLDPIYDFAEPHEYVQTSVEGHGQEAARTFMFTFFSLKLYSCFAHALLVWKDTGKKLQDFLCRKICRQESNAR